MENSIKLARPQPRYVGLVRDYVPVRRFSDDVLGLYDKVNNKFYTNAGSGEFIAGKRNSKNNIY